jgi:hypothetical protein
MSGVSVTISPEGSLVKFETVLDLEQIEDDWVGYSAPADLPRDLTIYLSADDYEELGEPQQITVRVRPGNALQADYEGEES